LPLASPSPSPPTPAAPPSVFASAPAATAAPSASQLAPPPPFGGVPEPARQPVQLKQPTITPLSSEAFNRFLPRFATVRSRDEVTDLILDFLAEGFVRVIMFVHVKGEIRGHDARGEDLMLDAVRQIRIPATGPSLFSNTIERRSAYLGPMRTDTAIDAAFDAALGGVEGNVLVLPVLVREKVPVVVFAATALHQVDGITVKELTEQASAAFERLIVAAKRN